MFLRRGSSWVNLDQVCEACQKGEEIYARMSNGYVLCLDGAYAIEAEIYFQRRELELTAREQEVFDSRVKITPEELMKMIEDA